MEFLNGFLKYEFINNSYFKYKLPIKNYYLIKWFPFSRTKIHGHNNKKCKFIILNDTLFEKRYLQNNTYKTENLKSFKIYSIDDSIGAHSVQNLDDRIKWSIHKYK
tara:strand:+ start:628 stop:945 length:318 start_codon:yes stop_codon:yes gene_type:complete